LYLLQRSGLMNNVQCVYACEDISLHFLTSFYQQRCDSPNHFVGIPVPSPFTP